MDRAERLRQILAARNANVSSVSRESARIFGRASRFYVPHNLYSEMADPSFAPGIQQLFAFSRITNYRLSDWLAVFGCDLDQIPRLQLQIPRPGTTLLDSSVYDTYAWIPWFAERPNAAPVPPIAPLRLLLAEASPRRAIDLLALNRRRFLYAKVGAGDLYALPSLGPGAIVRVDTERTVGSLFEDKTQAESTFFLVECGPGYTCSRLAVLAKDRVLLHSPQHPCAARELRPGRDARILGAVDAEIRPLPRDHAVREAMPAPASPLKPQLRPIPNPPADLKSLLKAARIRTGLSFREASALSRTIARMLTDEDYFAAPSTLSDYETLTEPPRRIQKTLTLCALYGIEFREFLRVSGIPLDEEGQEPMPDALVPRDEPHGSRRFPMASEEEDPPRPRGLLGRLLEQWEEIPLFIRHALAGLTGLKNFSLSDVYWVGGDTVPLHPLLRNATFVAVNRRVKKPAPSARETFCRQPIYLLLKRDGGYLCGHTTLEEANLLVHSYPGGPIGTQQFRDGVDAEVIGRVTAVFRRLV
jgi:hypothetical protein